MMKTKYSVAYSSSSLQQKSKAGHRKRAFSSWALTISMFALACFMLLPIYYIVISTIKTPEAVTVDPLGLPKIWDFSRYAEAWETMKYPRSLFNTLLISIPSVFFSTLFSAAAAYAIVRCPSRLNRAIFWLFLSGMMIPGNVSLISLYKLMMNLHLNNSRLGIIILCSGGANLMSIFLLRNFLSSAEMTEIEEAAELDGCTVLQKFFRVVVPLIKPVLATNVIISLMGVWNDYLTPSLFLSDPDKHTLLIAVYQNVGQHTTDWLTMFNMLVLALLPLTILYLFLQKHIIAGVTAGAVKG